MKNLHLDYFENSDALLFENYNYLSESEKENQNKKIMKKIMLYIIKYELTDRQRTIFMMRHIEAKTAAQIAAEMGIETVTVYKHLSAVEKCLMHYCEFFFIHNKLRRVYGKSKKRCNVNNSELFV